APEIVEQYDIVNLGDAGSNPPRRASMKQPHDFLPETETTVPIIRGAGEGKAVGVLRDRSLFKVLPEETGGAYAVLEKTIAGGRGPPVQVHTHEAEIFCTLDGEFEVTIGDKKVHSTAGALVAGPRGI